MTGHYWLPLLMAASGISHPFSISHFKVAIWPDLAASIEVRYHPASLRLSLFQSHSSMSILPASATSLLSQDSQTHSLSNSPRRPLLTAHSRICLCPLIPAPVSHVSASWHISVQPLAHLQIASQCRVLVQGDIVRWIDMVLLDQPA